MVEKQLRLRGVSDPRVLEVMGKVERERFVPEDLKKHAYDDRALPIGHDQTISQPFIVGLMSQLLQLRGEEKVLEIGTGSGYQAAILGELAKDVYTIELIPELAIDATHRLTELGYKNIHFRTGDGYKGWPEEAPYDAIIVTCAPEKVPQALIDQLKEGGRLVIPVGAQPKQQLILMQKTNGQMSEESVIPVSFVPMQSPPK